jgi:hypothetical protein
LPPTKKRTTRNSGGRKVTAKKAAAKKGTGRRSSTKTTVSRSSSTQKRAAGKSAAQGAGRFTMSQAHKDALAKGREASRHVRAYLEALERHRPRRGRQRTPESIQRQLAEVDAELGRAAPMRKLELIARRMQLDAELQSKNHKVDLATLRRNFIRYAPQYARSKGIPARAFREAGVPAADLREAGLK